MHDAYSRFSRSVQEGIPPSPPPSWLRVVTIIGLLGFIALAIAVVSGGTLRADDTLVLGMHADATAQLTVVMSDLTVLGYIPTITAIVVVADLLLWRWRRRLQAVLLTGIMLGEGAWDEGLKQAFHRARPDLFPRPSIHSFSFPSGHAFATACLLATLVALSWRHLPGFARWGMVILAAVLAFSIGASRVYLGVHYPSDILAGWFGAMAWLGGVGTWLRQRLITSQPSAQKILASAAAPSSQAEPAARAALGSADSSSVSSVQDQ